MMTKDKLRQLTGDERLGQMRDPSTWVPRTSMTAQSRCSPLRPVVRLCDPTARQRKQGRSFLQGRACPRHPAGTPADRELHQPQDAAEAVRRRQGIHAGGQADPAVCRSQCPGSAGRRHDRWHPYPALQTSCPEAGAWCRPVRTAAIPSRRLWGKTLIGWLLIRSRTTVFPWCAACAQKRKEAAAAAEMQQEAENAAEVQQDSSPESFTVDPDTGEVL